MENTGFEGFGLNFGFHKGELKFGFYTPKQTPLPKRYVVNKDPNRWDMNTLVERKLICSDPNVNPYDYEIIAISLAGMPFVKKGIEWKHFDTCSPLRETKHPIKNVWRRPFIAYRGTDETILICKKIC